MVGCLQRITEARAFRAFIIMAILAAGVLVGVETYPEMREAHGPLLRLLDQIILGIFVVEIAMKIGAQGRHPWRYFHDSWNIFDFTIVALCCLPFGTQFIAVLRIARVLRVLRLVTALPKLQLLVGALLRSIPSIGYVSLLLFLLFYIYAVMGVFLFSTNDPIHFGSLQIALVSLFRVVTLEDWTDIMYIQMYGSDSYAAETFIGLNVVPLAQPVTSAAFFISFVLVGTMIILNLFIGVIMNGMDEIQAETKRRELHESKQQLNRSVAEELDLLSHQLTTIKEHIDVLSERLEEESVAPEGRKRKTGEIQALRIA